MTKRSTVFRGILLICFIAFSLSLINLAQLMSFECGPTDLCTTAAWEACESLCGSMGECEGIELIDAFCDDGPCNEDYRYECYSGEWGFLFNCLGRDPDCEDPKK